MALLRQVLGDTLRRQRQAQRRTLREVSTSARVSLGYLSEIERGQKEASSELLSAICVALDIRLSELLHDISESVALIESEPTVDAAVTPSSAKLSSDGRAQVKHSVQLRKVETLHGRRPEQLVIADRAA